MDFSGDVPWFLLIAVVLLGMFVMGTIDMALKSYRKTQEVRERETSRREVAAYVAEGSMTPEEGERLLRAGTKADEKHAKAAGKAGQSREANRSVAASA